jgi:threonyl-tRNA synthetase
MQHSQKLNEIRHTAAHVMAAAVGRLFPEVKADIGPATENGFYYDFDLEHKFTAEDLKKIEAEMGEIVREDQKMVCETVSREEAGKLFRERGQAYKLERLQDIPEGEAITLYRNGEYVDLCCGPHTASTGAIKAFKLLSVSGSYYRGNEKNPQLQRIYGTAFDSQEALDEYLKQQEEAKKRDHKKLGKELQLFVIDDAVGQGLVLWLPKGKIILQELQKFIVEELDKRGYVQVQTPHIGKLGLFCTSGHFPYYKDSQFFPLIDKDALSKLASEGVSCAELSNRLDAGQVDGYLLKPMNCPMHIKLYASQYHSYRDLPVRMAEFGTVYRWEQSGELNGLIRVRGFTQDDAHIFCTEDQVFQEVKSCIEVVELIFKTLGMREFSVRISLRDPNSDKYVGDDSAWEKSENALREVVKAMKFPYVEKIGEAAFYGPKIDFVVKDAIGREWQLGTIQVDYNLPERFDIFYMGADNKPHRPVVIHRAPFGSLERFCGILIEHFAGNFPTWLSPEQVRILPINSDLISYGEAIVTTLKNAKVRCSVDPSAEKLGAKIRQAELEKIPYMLVIGKKEFETQTVTVRSRYSKEIDGKTLPIKEFLGCVSDEIATRKMF